jgi:hypothetical protein
MVLSSALNVSTALVGCSGAGFLQFIEELLCMRPNLGAIPGAHILFDLLPVLAVLHDGYMEEGLPYMKRWCYSLLHRPACRFSSWDSCISIIRSLLYWKSSQ